MMWWGPFVLIGMCAVMEFVAWFSHKYIMHGPLWKFHEDHHVPSKRFFQRNDIFVLLFAIPSATLIIGGLYSENLLLVWAGFGAALYGLCYFLIHDLYIHQRFSRLKSIDIPYLSAIRIAHSAHHRHLGKDHGECFGLLIVPRKYYRIAKKLSDMKKSKS